MIFITANAIGQVDTILHSVDFMNGELLQRGLI